MFSYNPLGNFFQKSQCQKTEWDDPLGFFNIHSVAKYQKLKGDPLGKKYSKKSNNPKKLKMGTL